LTGGILWRSYKSRQQQNHGCHLECHFDHNVRIVETTGRENFGIVYQSPKHKAPISARHEEKTPLFVERQHCGQQKRCRETNKEHHHRKGPFRIPVVSGNEFPSVANEENEWNHDTKLPLYR
jgi:hypothetical protein